VGFYKYFDGIAQLTYYRGRCLSYGGRHVLGAHGHGADGPGSSRRDPASARPSRVVRETFSTIGPPLRRGARLRHLLGLEDGLSFERDDLFAAWRLFFELTEPRS
jgi:hypothetical protein